MWPNLRIPADLVTFTEEILNEKLHFLCSDLILIRQRSTTLQNIYDGAFCKNNYGLRVTNCHRKMFFINMLDFFL